MRRAWLAGLFAAACGVLPASGLPASGGGQEQALSHFKDAMDRIDRRDWSAAIDELERAVELQPRPDGGLFVLRYGRLTRNYYLPYFYLGLACFESGDRARAAEYLARSLAQGEVAAHDDLRRRLERMQQALGPAVRRSGRGGTA